MTDERRLDTLPSDVLILIFDYCHAFDLVRLSEVCTRFYDIIREDTLWIKKSHLPVATNQVSRRFCDRCNPILSLRKKWHVSHNWLCGRYENKILLSQKTKLMPWLKLTNDTLWWTGGDQLIGFKRSEHINDMICNKYNVHYCIYSDICKFTIHNDYIISGHRDGSIRFWSTTQYKNYTCFSIERAHSHDVNAVDATPGATISGSSNGTVKIWAPAGETLSNVPLKTINLTDRVCAVAADPTGTTLAVGSAGVVDGCPPLHIFDIESCIQNNILQHTWRRGAGILHMIWENPNILLTGGYDAYLRKWDLRTGKCVYAWPDPADAGIYCISSDYQYSVITGTQYNCKAVLWDQRQRKYVQLYFINLRGGYSPVYSIAFDSSHLYGAIDRRLVELKFSGYTYKQKDYSNIFQYYADHKRYKTVCARYSCECTI